MDFYRKGPLDCEFDFSGRNEALEVLAQRIAQLPRIPQTVLALYYYENLGPAEIATALGLTENEVELIRFQTMRLLRNKLVDDLKQPDGLA